MYKRKIISVSAHKLYSNLIPTVATIFTPSCGQERLWKWDWQCSAILGAYLLSGTHVAPDEKIFSLRSTDWAWEPTINFLVLPNLINVHDSVLDKFFLWQMNNGDHDDDANDAEDDDDNDSDSNNDDYDDDLSQSTSMLLNHLY